MKKKTKITLAVMTSLMIGGGIGTAIGYGVWGTHDDKPAEVSSEATPEPVRDSDSSGEIGSASLADSGDVKPAFRFGLRAPVMKSAPAIPDADAFINSLMVWRNLDAVAHDNGSGGRNNVILKRGDIAKEGYVILRFKSFGSLCSGFAPASTYIGDEEENTTDWHSISSIGLLTLSYGDSDSGEPDKWDYITFNTKTIGSATSTDGDCFYIVINMNDFPNDNQDDLYLGSDSWPSGTISVMHSRNYSYNTIVDGTTKDIYVDVDKNYSKDTIISSVSAKDLFGQDVPVTVTEGLDSFTPQTIGVYTLKLKATDSYGQTATATLIVHICDYVGPNVTQKKQLTFTADKGQKLSYGDLASYISVTDNGTSHGSSVTVTYAYDGTTMNTDWEKTFVAADYGTHNVKVTARDGSGNTTEKTFVLKVNDGTAPVISRKDGQEVGSTITVGLSKVFSMNLRDILAMYKATDNVDGDVSASLAGVGDEDKNFFAKHHHVGNYTLHITAKDKDNNASTLNIPIVISADMPPVFLISDTLVYTDTATPLTTAALAKVITNGVLAKKNISSLNIDASDYIGNEDKAGTYKVTYDYTEAAVVKAARRFNAASEVKSGSLDIVVTEAENVKEDEKEPTNFFAKAIKAIKDFFKKIAGFFQKIGNWFRGVFTKFKFDCFITDDEWDLRFGKKASDSSVLAPAGEDSAGK